MHILMQNDMNIINTAVYLLHVHGVNLRKIIFLFQIFQWMFSSMNVLFTAEFPDEKLTKKDKLVAAR